MHIREHLTVVHRRPAEGRAARPPRRARPRRASSPSSPPVTTAPPRCRPTPTGWPSTSPSPTSRTSSTSTCPSSTSIRDAEDVWTLTYEIARDLAGAEGPLRRADPDAVLVDRARHPGRGVLRRRRGRPPPRAADFGVHCAGASTSPARRASPAGRRHPRRRVPPAPGRAGQLRPGRPGARRAARAVRRRTSPPPAPPGCTASRTPANPTGPESIWDALDQLGAERIGHGIAAARDERLLEHLRDRGDPARGVPDVQRLHPLRPLARRAPAAGTRRRRRARHDQLRRPADVLDHAQPRVRNRRRPAAAGRGRHRRTGPGRRAARPSWTTPASARSLPRSTSTRPSSVRPADYPGRRARSVHLPARAGDDPARAGRLQVPRPARPGHLRRQGQEPAATAELLLRRRRRAAPAHPADGHERRAASSGRWCAPRSRRCSSNTPGSRSSTRASTSATATTSPIRRWR